jgi:serine/threonine protein kinase
MKIGTHDRGDDSAPHRVGSAPRERWVHPFAAITEEPLRDPPALVQRVAPSDRTRDALLVARIDAVHRVLGRCSVPHVLPLLGVERSADGGVVLLHREVLGEDLGTMLARGPLALERVFAVLRQLCRAIGRAHAVGIEHRLLGPASVVLTGRGTGPGVIEIIDFGLAAIVDPDEIRDDAMELAPITPERVLGGGTPVSEDIYSIGALALFMIAGRPPFRARDAATLRRRHAIEDCPSLADLAAYDVPDALVHAIDRALHKDPDDRHAEVAELEAEIVRAQRDARIETAYDALLDGPPPRDLPRPRRRKTAPMSTNPATVDIGADPGGAADPGTFSKASASRGGTLVVHARRRAGRGWRARAIASLLFAAGSLGGWLAVASTRATNDTPTSVAPREPDAPSVYAHREPAPPKPATMPEPELEPEPPSEAPPEDDLAWIVIENETPEPSAPHRANLHPSTCAAARRSAYDARTEHRWSALLSATRHAECWAAPRERAKLRVKALMELRRFEACAKVGGALAQPDPELGRWVALCRERAKERYAAASTQQ